MKFLILISTLLTLNCASQDCGIQITHTWLDSSKVITNFYDDMRVRYKSKGRSTIQLIIDDTVTETLEVVTVRKGDEFIELHLRNLQSAIVPYRFYCKETKLVTVVEQNNYQITETGLGLSYKISRRIKGTGKTLPALP